MRAILDEKVDTADMVALAKEWHKKVEYARTFILAGAAE